MNGVIIVAKKDLRETLRSKASLFGIGLTLFMMAAAISLFNISIEPLLRQGLSTTILVTEIRLTIGTNVYAISFAIMIYVGIYINSYTLMIEKTKNSVESFLCTPISLKQFWFGKTISLFIYSLVLGAFGTIGAICISNILIISPAVGHWVIPDTILFVSLAEIPIIVFLLSSIFTLLQLLFTNVRLVISAFGAIAGGSLFILLNVRALASWTTIYVSFTIVIILALVICILSKLLTKERVVLSSKGQ
jgi:ABC-type Na+ efflux pump permease subunit